MKEEKRRSEILKFFKKSFGDPKTELNFENSFQLLISVMLSAQSTDKKVNEITPALFKAYPDPGKLMKAPLSKVEALIRQVNYHKTKARHLIATAKILFEKHKSQIPSTREDLEELPGVGSKTASVVLSELGHDYAFPVDTHVYRVSRMLGFATSSTREKVGKELCEIFPKKSWHHLHHWLIFHGRRTCVARNPKCSECGVSKLCPSAKIDN